jgi:hypothetical protein
MAEKELNTQKAEWSKYDFGHLKVMRELGIAENTLPKELREKIRGLNLGLTKIKDDTGFQKLVTLGASIGDSIITWHEQGIDVTEDQFNENQKKEEEERQRLANEEAEKQRIANEEIEKKRIADEQAQKKLDLEAQQRVANHVAPDKDDKGTHQTNNGNDDGGVFFWD